MMIKPTNSAKMTPMVAAAMGTDAGETAATANKQDPNPITRMNSDASKLPESFRLLKNRLPMVSPSALSKADSTGSCALQDDVKRPVYLPDSLESIFAPQELRILLLRADVEFASLSRIDLKATQQRPW